jgi:PhoPQ-activated pathogenicity-related protein
MLYENRGTALGRAAGVAALILAAMSAASGDLFDYVAKPDDSFRWELRGVAEKPNGKVYDLQMTSQVWMGITWEHQLQVYEPARLEFPDLMPLLITGGSAGDEDQSLGLTIANVIGARIATIYHIPNQPLFDNLREDALISYTWVKYIETGDEDWVLLFPMVKAAVRAMDCLEALAEQQWGVKLRGFMPLGASKRGWTTYLTAIAAPERCVAIAPMVFDILNMPIQIEHQRDFWGDYSPEISDYTEKGLEQVLGTERGFRLSWISDPYSYRDRLTMPKLIILGSNDPYWPVDAVNLYYPGLPSPKLLLIAPNSGHGLDDMARVMGSLGGFFRLTAKGEPLPQARWLFTETPDLLKLEFSSQPQAAEGSVWVARSPVRDFRQANWEQAPLTAGEDGGFVAEIDRAEGAYVAAYGEMVFTVGNLRLTASTQPRVLHPISR